MYYIIVTISILLFIFSLIYKKSKGIDINIKLYITKLISVIFMLLIIMLLSKFLHII